MRQSIRTILLPAAERLAGARRGAAMLFTTLLLTMTAQTTRAMDGVNYIDANGNSLSADNVTEINTSDMPTELSGWYVVTEDVTYTETIRLTGDVNLILGDNTTLTITPASENSFSGSSNTLTVWAQSSGTSMGSLSASGNGYNSAIWVNGFVLNGGHVTTTVGNIYTEHGDIVINGGFLESSIPSASDISTICSGRYFTMNGGKVVATVPGSNGTEAAAIWSGDALTINGGQLEAIVDGNGGAYGLYTRKSNSNITLGYTNASDYIKATSYHTNNSDSHVVVAGSKTLYDETGASYAAGNLSDGQVSAIAGKMLMPEMAGTGGVSDPYVISSAAQLKLMASRVNGGEEYFGKYFQLGADITFNKNESNNFTPIGNGGNAFSGTFDGQGYTISGIRISDPGGFDKAIFGRVVEGTVKNLVVSDCRIEARTGGGIVAALESATIENCHVGSDVTLTGNRYIGGIAAGCNNGEITGCTSAATITGTIDSGNNASYLGGIAGATRAGSTLTDNLFLGTIGGDLNEYIGAITGYDNSGEVRNTFTNNAYTCEDYKGVGTASPNPSYDVEGTRKLKNIATCTASVPNPIYHSTYTHSYFYDGTWNDNHGGIEVYDGETLLTYGTDYRYKMMESLDGGNCENLNENCRVYLEGLGDYTGELYRDVVIVPATVTNESWGSLKWSLDADGNFTSSGTGAMNAATTFRNYTWYNYCSYFKTITIGEGITTVAAGAFGGDSNTNPYTTVTTVNLPSTLTTIGDNAFAYCTGLTSLTIPASVTTVGANAFNQCNSLDEVYCFADLFTTWEGNETTFKTDPNDSNNKTTFYVTDADAWTTAYPDANVMYVGSTPVSYIDENGKQQSRLAYTVLRTDNPGNLNYGNLPGGWYVVENCNPDDENNGGVDFYREGNVQFQGDAHLILCDGAEMSVSNFDGSTPFQSSGALTIYGQSGGTGRLSVTNTHQSNGSGLTARYGLTINGGIISASINISSEYAISCGFGDVVINGGTVTATAPNVAIDGMNIAINGGTVMANGSVSSTWSGEGRGTITLGWRTAADRITANSYECTTVKIADGQAFTNGTDAYYLGTLTDAEKTAIANVELQPVAVAGVTLTKDGSGELTATLDPTSEGEVNIPVAVSVDHVNVDRIYVNGKASTVYLPFSIAYDKVSGGKFHTFTSVDETKDPWEVKYTEVPSYGNIEANTPYIFLPDGTNSGKIVVNNGTDKVSVSTANPQTTTQGQWEFIGTYERIKWTHDDTDPEYTAAREAEIGSVYGFAAVDKGSDHVGDFVKVGNNVFINPMRAYLKRTPSSTARATTRGAQTEQLPDKMRVVIVSADGTSTEIGTLDTRTGEIRLDEWYSLDGTKLSGEPTKKGVYIHKGIKVKR